MKKRLIYEDPTTGRKLYLSEVTLVFLVLIVGATIVGAAYCIGWGAGFAALGLPATLIARKYLGIPVGLTDNDST